MLRYGACYYPEHWTAEQARQHIPLMQKAGINVVRMGEFAWCKFEPEPGRYKFDWLDPVIDALAKAGIATVLGTPTAIPPNWAYSRQPNILQKNAGGHTLNPGARCHCCKNAPGYQFMCEGIVQEMARHYKDNPAVIGWQVDNEFGCHNTTRCFCEHCEKAFREWLIAKYGDIEALNAAWGTSFWGFDFRQWNEIPLPRTMPTGPNPGHWLDFVRFSSDTQVKFMKTQYDLIKALCPKHFVTHNYMGCFPEIDYYKLSQHLDFPVWDNYPDSYGDPFHPSYAHEITRSFKGRFWVMEEKSGPTGDAEAGLLGEQPEPGEIRRWAWQAVANGADGVVYFRWRVCLFGAEQYWHGILDHDGVPRRRYAEVRKTAEEFIKVAPELEGTQVEVRVALIRHFDTLWSFERQPGVAGFHYDGHCFEMYRAIKQNGHNCDIVNADADFTRYRVVVAPSLALADDALAKRLHAFADAGGTVVFTPQSGVRTPANAMWDRSRPGPLAPLVGATVDEVRPYYHGQTNEIAFRQGVLAGQTCSVGTWVEILHAAGAETVAEFRDEPFAGKPAITCNTVGKGKVYYLGVFLPNPVLKAFLGGILPEFPMKDIPDGVEVTMRRGKQGRIVFVLNNTRERQTLTLPGQFPDLLSGETVGPKITLARNGVLVLKA
ncbi:MAG TPA: beta-galactosidase [Candidatus Hydrogenedentes bacterium]|nr:beta-galactosidase [Candidatus Hydrogenedentota bacterium]HRT19587.1 beta-galactosidase [Candidatus Hydrogenedentota bacterium]HRT64157.1 beta-galactosidase [Candidatus Hydrogenedentota bacterium]